MLVDSEAKTLAIGGMPKNETRAGSRDGMMAADKRVAANVVRRTRCCFEVGADSQEGRFRLSMLLDVDGTLCRGMTGSLDRIVWYKVEAVWTKGDLYTDFWGLAAAC